MTWLLAQTWLFAVAAFVLGALLTWLFLVRPRDRALDEMEHRLAHPPTAEASAVTDDHELADARARIAALEAQLAEQDQAYRIRLGDLEADLNGARARIADFELRLNRRDDVQFTGAGATPTAGPYPNSAEPLPGGTAPRGFTIKGAAGEMRYHPPESPRYGDTVAEVWFRTDEDAEAAGFKAWNTPRD